MSDDLSNRIRLLNDAFATDMFKEQLQRWNIEKQTNRSVLSDYWSSSCTDFISFWENGEGASDVKPALVLTVLEDVFENGISGAFVHVVCPELPKLYDTVRLTLNGESPSPSVANSVVNIVTCVSQSTENDSSNFNRDEITAIIKNSKLEKGDFILHSLMLARSCILLQFSINLFLLYSNTA